MTRSGPHSRATLLAFVIAAAALAFRVWGPADRIFQPGFVNFQGDAWYHMRAVDHLVRNFPHRLTWDPYVTPDGSYVAIAPLLDDLIAAVALVLGLGAPSARLVDIVGAVMPAALGSIATLLTYWLGARVFDRRTGLLAAALLAIMPGPFLDVTLLGAADHHALEAVLVLATICLLVGASRAAGVSLGAYFLTWTSAPLFGFGTFVWAALQFTWNRARSRPSAPLATLLMSTAAIALVLVLLFQNPAIFRYWMQVSTLAAVLGLGIIMATVERFRIRGTRLAAAAAAGAVVAGIGLLAHVWALPAGLVADLGRFRPHGLGRTIAEMQPLLQLSGRFSWMHPWNVFRTPFYLGVAALAALVARMIAGEDAGRLLVAVWSAVVLAATLGQLRFGYYLAPMLAILTGWSCSSLFTWIGSRWPGRWGTELAIVGVAALVFFPAMQLGVVATRVDVGVPKVWQQALIWLRTRTPDPFGDEAVYFRRYDRGPIPRPSYTVMAWWDYGYWIVRAARRVPVSNPTQYGAGDAGQFFTATTEQEALERLAALRARYVIVDRELSFARSKNGGIVSGEFDAMTQWAGRRSSDFFETMVSRTPDGRLAPVIVFTPGYYRTMAVRLSRFGPGRVEPDNSTWVVSYEDRTAADGSRYREIVQSARFATYAAAVAYLQSLGDGPHRLVGLDPDKTCVPLPALETLHLVHEDQTAPDTDVRIFDAS